MNTPKKVKLYTERTRAKDRTAKNKRGNKGQTQRSDFGCMSKPMDEGSKPNHAVRSISKDGLNAIFTRSDVLLTASACDDHTHAEAVEPDTQNRGDRRQAKRRRTILNSIFRTRGNK